MFTQQNKEDGERPPLEDTPDYTGDHPRVGYRDGGSVSSSRGRFSLKKLSVYIDHTGEDGKHKLQTDFTIEDYNIAMLFNPSLKAHHFVCVFLPHCEL